MAMELTDAPGWQEIADGLCQAATNTLGTTKGFAGSPWLAAHRSEGNTHRDRIGELTRRLREATSQDGKSACKRDRNGARSAYRRDKRKWETEWWSALAKRAADAAAMDDHKTMHDCLKQAGASQSRRLHPVSVESLTSVAERVGRDRYERTDEEVQTLIAGLPDKRYDPKYRAAAQKLDKPLTDDEIDRAINKMTDGAPGDDNTRISYIKKAGPAMKNRVRVVVQRM